MAPPEEINLALAQRFQRIRKRRGLSQLQLSEKSNVSYGSIKHFETIGQISLIPLTKLCAALDYHTFMKLTSILSRSNPQDLEQMYRRMCFNVFAHNRDDHAKNFSWLYDPQNDYWHPSPSYDLTWSTTYYGEHTTTVDGNGRDPGMKGLLAVGKAAGMGQKVCRQIAEDIRQKTSALVEKYRGIRS